MLVKQSKNSFIRCTEKYGYIINQLTRHDRTYDEYGADILRLISRSPQSIDEIVEKLMSLYEGVEYSTLREDVVSFLESLAADYFVVMGDTVEELENRDPSFTYLIDNPKTLRNDFTQTTEENVNISTAEFFSREIVERPLISNLQFELSSRCNERCIHCYIPDGKKNHGFDMPLSKVKSLIDEFAELGGINVTLSGGEVFLYKKLKEVVEYCRQKDLKITILSNLIALKDDDLRWLKDTNVSLIQVSLYSMDPEKHDTITTVKGSWKRTKDAIEKLVSHDIPVQISCPIMKANKIGYGEVLEYARSLKIKAQTDFIMMARSDLATDNLANRLSIEETEVVIRDIIANDPDYELDTLEKLSKSEEFEIDPENFKSSPVCGVGFDNCCVTANGDIYPCAGWQDMVLGNVNKQSLKDIWENSEKVKELRKITQSSFPECLQCEAMDYCARCLVRNYNESGGDMFAINKHFCKVAFLNKRLVEEEFNKVKNRDRQNN